MYIPKQELLEIRQQVQLFFFFAPSGVMLRHAVGQQQPTALLAHIYTADSTRIFKIRSVFCFFFNIKEPKLRIFRFKDPISGTNLHCSFCWGHSLRGETFLLIPENNGLGVFSYT